MYEAERAVEVEVVDEEVEEVEVRWSRSGGWM